MILPLVLWVRVFYVSSFSSLSEPFRNGLSLPQIERQSKALDKKAARMQAELRDEAKEGLERDVLEGREALGLVPAGEEDEEEGEEGQEEETVPPQVLKERIESVIEVLSEFQVRPLDVLLVCKRVGPVDFGVSNLQDAAVGVRRFLVFRSFSS